MSEMANNPETVNLPATSFFESETSAGRLTALDTAKREESPISTFARITNRQSFDISSVWQELTMMRGCDALFEIAFFAAEEKQLPRVSQWCETTSKDAQCVTETVSVIEKCEGAYFTASETACGANSIHKTEKNGLFLNTTTGRGYVRIFGKDTERFENRLHELVWQFQIRDSSGAKIVKANGTLYIEPFGAVCGF